MMFFEEWGFLVNEYFTHFHFLLLSLLFFSPLISFFNFHFSFSSFFVDYNNNCIDFNFNVVFFFYLLVDTTTISTFSPPLPLLGFLLLTLFSSCLTIVFGYDCTSPWRSDIGIFLSLLSLSLTFFSLICSLKSVAQSTFAGSNIFYFFERIS